MLVPPASVGAELVHADRGGDVTYHGPGQLVGYPIVTLPEWRDGLRDVVAYVRTLEAGARSRALADLGVDAAPRAGFTGVWVGDEKIAAIGVKVAGGRTRHGFALNVDPDLSMFDHIVPCGIADRGVTSIARLLGDAARRCAASSTRWSRASPTTFGTTPVDRQDVAVAAATTAPHRRVVGVTCREGEPPRGEPVRLLGRLAEAGVEAPADDPRSGGPSG